MVYGIAEDQGWLRVVDQERVQGSSEVRLESELRSDQCLILRYLGTLGNFKHES